MKNRTSKLLERPPRLRAVLLIQILVAAVLLLAMAAFNSSDTAADDVSDAAHLIVCNAPVPLADFSIGLAGCQVRHCTESLSGAERYRQLEFFIC